MNIFYTHTNPNKCARYLDDKRLNKMLIESVQIWSTVKILKGADAPYKKTHEHHPIVKNILNSRANYYFLDSLIWAYASQYYIRFKKHHKSFILFKQYDLELIYNTYDKLNLLNCAKNTSLGIDYTDIPDINEAYQLYLVHRWMTDKRKPKWNGIELAPRLIFPNLDLTKLKI